MSKSVLNAKAFQSEEAAYKWIEARVWPQGPVCPHCGGMERLSKMQGKATRIGLYKCYACRKQFRVTVGTVFESSHVPMNLWLQAIYLMTSSKKGISSNQLHRTLGVTLKTAWFMSHRLREAMRTVGIEPMGGEGAIIEADETYMGEMEEPRPRPLATGAPSLRVASPALAPSAPSSASSSVAGPSAPSTSNTPPAPSSLTSSGTTPRRGAACIPTRASSTRRSDRNTPPMRS